jgi:hypothetical protein
LDNLQLSKCADDDDVPQKGPTTKAELEMGSTLSTASGSECFLKRYALSTHNYREVQLPQQGKRSMRFPMVAEAVELLLNLDLARSKSMRVMEWTLTRILLYSLVKA